MGITAASEKLSEIWLGWFGYYAQRNESFITCQAMGLVMSKQEAKTQVAGQNECGFEKNVCADSRCTGQRLSGRTIPE